MRRIPNLMLWVLAGVVSGMAILTRSTGIVLVGVTGLALLIRTVHDARHGITWIYAIGAACRDGAVWLVSTLVTIVILLPALWVEPVSTLEKLWAWSSNAATEGHENPTFYRGIHQGDPGLIVYPVVLLWRTSPAEWLGIGLFVMLSWWGIRMSQLRPATIAFLCVIIVFAIVYVAAMSLGAKKFDRYILPDFPVIAIVAAQGIGFLGSWIKSTNIRWRRTITSTVITAVLVVQIYAWNSSRPYRLDYYNPLLGGPTAAEHVLQMGWGQGGDQVVDYLLSQTSEGPITVQTSAVPSAFTYFLDDDSPVHFKDFGLGTPAGWYETDYYVAGIQQTQRNIAPWFDLVKDTTPVHSVKIGGVSYFDIYKVKNQRLPNTLKKPTACNYQFGSEITLMQIIGRDDTIDFYFLSTEAASGDEITLTITINSANGEQNQQTVSMTPASAGHMNKITIPKPTGDLAASQIVIRAQMNGTDLVVSSPWTTEMTTEAITQSECYYTAPPG